MPETIAINVAGAAFNDLLFSDPDCNALNGDPLICSGSPLRTIRGQISF